MIKNFVIHDIKIKSLLRKLDSKSKLSIDDDIYKDILEQISEFIYNFPKLKYHKNKDICSDFYLYTLDYLNEILMKFDIKGKASFQTWFSIVLFNLWRNYQNTRKSKDNQIKNNDIVIDDLDYINRFKSLQESVIHKSNDENNGIFINDKEIIKLDECFKQMPKKVRVVLKAHFFELFQSSDIMEAVNAFQLDFMVTLRKYEVLVTKTRDQYEIVCNLIEKINETIYQIKNIKTLYSGKNIEQSDIENKIQKLSTKKEKLVDKLKNTYIKLTPKQIADFFNSNANSISNLLHRGKNYVKDYYLKHV